MAVVRQANLVAFENDLSQATLDWSHDSVVTGLDPYLFKHGVFHLLEQGRDLEAKQRMLDIHFMAGFTKVYETVVEPLKAFRVVGVEEMRQGLSDAVQRSPSFEELSLNDGYQYGILASFLQKGGIFDVGILFAEKQYKIYEKELGEKHADTLKSMNNLAHLYSEEGRYKESELLSIQTLALSERCLGVEHPDTLTSVNNLAWLYYRQGRYEEAEPLYARVVDARKRTLGIEHPDTLTKVGNLALLYSEQGQYEVAEALNVRVTEASERTLGPRHPDTLTSVNNLASLYSMMERYSESESMYFRVLEVSERTLGPEHLDTLKVMESIGWVYEAQEKYSEAELVYVQILESKERTIGVEHPETLKVVDMLAWVYLNQHKSEGEPLFSRLLESWSESWDFAHHWANFGLALSNALGTGDFSVAESILTVIMNVWRDSTDWIEKGQDKIDKAKAYYQQNI